MKISRTEVIVAITLSAGAAAGVAATMPGGARAGLASAAGPASPCAAANRGLRYPVGTAKHLIFAVSADYSSNAVVVTECVRRDGGWTATRQVDGRAGAGGFAAPGAKREGDGKSPTGSFTLSSAFGVKEPGTRLPYRRLRAEGDCWGATPGARHYNDYYAGTCGPADEDLSAIAARGPYHQAVVIDYNRPDPVPGNGSAIFFHVGGVTPTSGCVAIPEPDLRAMMRTLAAGDRMIMGPRSALFGS